MQEVVIKDCEMVCVCACVIVASKSLQGRVSLLKKKKKPLYLS